MGGYLYRLFLEDGSDVGTFTTIAWDWKIGDMFFDGTHRDRGSQGQRGLGHAPHRRLRERPLGARSARPRCDSHKGHSRSER
jgi:hypothetical protein